jgi:hypothetical protein
MLWSEKPAKNSTNNSNISSNNNDSISSDSSSGISMNAPGSMRLGIAKVSVIAYTHTYLYAQYIVASVLCSSVCACYAVVHTIQAYYTADVCTSHIYVVCFNSTCIY